MKNKQVFVVHAFNVTITVMMFIYKYLYILRSLPEKKLFRVSGLGKLSMAQTYAGMLDAKMSVHK